MNTNRFHRRLPGRAVAAQDREAKKAAFTAIELLVVIACVGIMAVTLLPALAGTRQNSQIIGCLNNQRQLAAAWTMYARDDNDALVPNRGLGGASGVNYATDPRVASNLQPGGANADWCPGTLQMSQDTVPGSQYPGGSRYSWWIQTGLLYPYINSINVYHCPADHSLVPRGVVPFTAPSLRTYSMNAWVQPMDAPGYKTTVWDGISGYLYYTKLSSFTRPGPSKTWVFTEESPYTIDDAFFAIDPRETTTWYNLPAVLHGNASVLAFADGHTDSRHWTDGSMINGKSSNWPAEPNSADLPWLVSISTAHQ